LANLIAVVAKAGSGKSTSIFPNEEIGIKGLDPKETVIINVSSKPLPVKGANKLYPIGKISEGGRQIMTSDPVVICAALQQISDKYPDIKNVIVDDAGYLQSFLFMAKVKEKGYEKFNEIAEAAFKPIKVASTLRSDLNVVFTYHDEAEADGARKIRTAGKMIDQYITLEGLFTVVLFGRTETNVLSKKTRYFFTTNTDGNNTAKSPIGMFTEMEIPNDLGYVVERVNSYYNG